MDSQSFVLVPRQLDGPAPPEAKPLTIHWRMIMILLTPLLLAIANLVEARFEKLRGFQVGANEYLASDNRGKAFRDGVIRGAIDRGNARYEALIAEAKNEARMEVEVGGFERETKIQQGHAKAAIQEPLAKGPIVALFGNTPEIVRLALERAEMQIGAASGRYLRVDRKTGRFEVRELATNDRARTEMLERLTVLRIAAGYELDQLAKQSISGGAQSLALAAGATSCSSN